MRGRLPKPLILEILLCARLIWASLQHCSRPLISPNLLSVWGHVKNNAEEKKTRISQVNFHRHLSHHSHATDRKSIEIKKVHSLMDVNVLPSGYGRDPVSLTTHSRTNPSFLSSGCGRSSPPENSSTLLTKVKKVSVHLSEEILPLNPQSVGNHLLKFTVIQGQ